MAIKFVVVQNWIISYNWWVDLFSNWSCLSLFCLWVFFLWCHWTRPRQQVLLELHFCLLHPKSWIKLVCVLYTKTFLLASSLGSCHHHPSCFTQQNNVCSHWSRSWIFALSQINFQAINNFCTFWFAVLKINKNVQPAEHDFCAKSL